MSWTKRFGRKQSAPKVIEKKMSDIDIGLSRISRDLALSDLHLDKLYRPILERVCAILSDVEARDKFNDIVDVLAEMLRFRRGVTLPENIEAELVQRYREICNYTLFLAVLAKLMAEYHARYAIQFDASGEIRNYPALFTYAMSNETKRIGVTKAANDVIGSGVDEGLAIIQLADFFKIVPNAVVWFASFPDMLKILFSLCLGTRRGQFSEITDKYASLAIGRCFGSDATTSVSQAVAAPSAPKVGTLFQSVESSSQERTHDNAVTSTPNVAEIVNESKSGEVAPSPETVVAPPSEPKGLNPALADLLSSISASTSPKGKGEPNEDVPQVKEQENNQSSNYELKRFHTLLVEHCHELQRWHFNETGEDVIAIPARLYRQLSSSLYRHLSGQKKSEAEQGFMLIITPHLRGPVHKGVTGPQLTDRGERMMLVTREFYQSFDGPDIKTSL